MRRLAALLLMTGCAPAIQVGAIAPPALPPTGASHPLAIDYELLSTAVGVACANPATLADMNARKGSDVAVGHPYLYELAKYNAIGDAARADGLMLIRARADFATDGKVCVTVSGRAYRLRSVRATPGKPESNAPTVQRGSGDSGMPSVLPE
jgi:hypothetical protein